MWARSRGALGLRGRIIGAVLVTSVATLAVAALLLPLGPLEQSLRNAELTTLRGEVGSQKRTGPASFANTVAPFKASNPGIVGLADIPAGPNTRPSSGGAATV